MSLKTSFSSLMHSSTLHLSIPSSLEEVELLHARLVTFISENGFTDALKMRAELAIIEALTNAIRHGNQHDPLKMVELKLWTSPNILTCEVSDQGEGFDPEKVADPLVSDNLLKTGGRGVFLLREMADEATFENGGRVIRMVFRE